MFVVIETKKKNIHSGPKGRAKKERIIRKECMLLYRVFTLIREL